MVRPRRNCMISVRTKRSIIVYLSYILLVLHSFHSAKCTPASSSSTNDTPASSSQSTGLCFYFDNPADRTLEHAPNDFGIMTQDGFSPIIPKGTRIPVVKKQIYYTTKDYQLRAKIQVRQDTDIDLGTLTVYGIPPKRAGQAGVEVTFDVNQNGVITVSAMETSTRKVTKLSLASNSMNTVERTYLESGDKTFRKVTTTILGAWFWETHKHMTTRQRAVKEFESSKKAQEFVDNLNRLLEHQKKTYKDELSGSSQDTIEINEAFWIVMEKVAKDLKPMYIKANLPDGLTQLQYNQIFNNRMPIIINEITEGGKNLDLAGVKGTAWVQRGAQTVTTPKAESIDPEFFWKSGGYTQIPVNFAIVQNSLALLDKFSAFNATFYKQKGWSAEACSQGYDKVLDKLAGLCQMQPRRGAGEEQAELCAQVVEVFEQILRQGETDPMAMCWDNVIRTIYNEFGE